MFRASDKFALNVLKLRFGNGQYAELRLTRNRNCLCAFTILLLIYGTALKIPEPNLFSTFCNTMMFQLGAGLAKARRKKRRAMTSSRAPAPLHRPRQRMWRSGSAGRHRGNRTTGSPMKSLLGPPKKSLISVEGEAKRESHTRHSSRTDPTTSF